MFNLIKFLFIFTCLFQENCFSDSWNRIFLTSFPRSGNHWIRFLVEEASNIATSSVKIDHYPPHMTKLFRWGGFAAQNGYEGDCRYPKINETVLLKTHYPAHKKRLGDTLKSKGAIRLIRHPVDSFYSYYSYEPRLRGYKAEAIVPSFIVKKFIEIWKRYQEYWNSAPNVMTFRYEDLLDASYLNSTLSTILKTLDYNVDKEDIERACNKYPPQGGPLKHIDKFTKEDLNLIVTELKDLMEKFDYTIPPEYLQ